MSTIWQWTVNEGDVALEYERATGQDWLALSPIAKDRLINFVWRALEGQSGELEDALHYTVKEFCEVGGKA